MLDRLLDVVSTDLERWGERDRVTSLLSDVATRGTSAQRQRAIRTSGGSFHDVVGWLVHETIEQT